MAFPYTGDFNDEIYPPYKNIVKDIENMPEFAHTRSEFKILKVFSEKIHEELDKLEQYLSYGNFRPYRWSIYAALGKIVDLTKAMDERIDKIKMKIKEIPRYKTFEYYISRVQLEVIEPIMGNAQTLKSYIEQGYDIPAEVSKFIRGTRAALRELEKMINEVLTYT
jgi:hypothetical protein